MGSIQGFIRSLNPNSDQNQLRNMAMQEQELELANKQAKEKSISDIIREAVTKEATGQQGPLPAGDTSIADRFFKNTMSNPNEVYNRLPQERAKEYATGYKALNEQDDGALNRKLREEQMNNLQEERTNRRQFQIDSKKSDVIKVFNSDPSVKKYQQSIDAADTIIELANSGNPIAAASIPTYSARMSGEVGNLSEADKRPFGGSKAILQRIKAATVEAASGNLSEDNKQFIIQLSEIIKKRSNENMDRLAQKRAAQYERAKIYGTSSEIYSALRPNAEVSTGMEMSPPPNPSSNTSEVERIVDGKTAIFDSNTKKFIRWK